MRKIRILFNVLFGLAAFCIAALAAIVGSALPLLLLIPVGMVYLLVWSDL